MTPSPYYTGDTVPLKFTVSDDNGPVTPQSCVVHILKPDNEYKDDTEAIINENEVSYNVPGDVNDIGGLYKAYFVCLMSYGERTHKIEYTVIHNPEVNR